MIENTELVTNHTDPLQQALAAWWRMRALSFVSRTTLDAR